MADVAVTFKADASQVVSAAQAAATSIGAFGTSAQTAAAAATRLSAASAVLTNAQTTSATATRQVTAALSSESSAAVQAGQAAQQAVTGHNALTSASNNNRMAYMEFGHSARSVTDALVAGMSPLRALAMETPRLTQAYIELSPAAQASTLRIAAMAGPVAVLAAGLAYLAFQAYAAETALQHLDDHTAAMGRVAEVTSGQTRALAERVAHDYDMSEKSAAGLVSTINSIPQATEQTRAKLADLIPAYAKASDDDADKVADRLGKAFSSLPALTSFAEANNMVDAGLRKTLDTAKTTNDIFTAQSAVMDALTARYGAYADKVKTRDQATSASSLLSHAATAEGGDEPAPIPKVPRLADSAPDGPSDAQQRAQELIESNERYLGTQREVNELTTRQKALEEGLASPIGQTTEQLATMRSELTGVNADLAKAQAGPAKGQDWREELQNRLTAEQHFGKAALAEELSFWEGKKALAAKGTEDERTVSSEIYRIESEQAAQKEALGRRGAAVAKHDSQEEWETYAAGVRQQIDDAQGNAAQQASLVQQWVSKAEQLYGQNSSAYRQASAEQSRLAREAAEEQLSVLQRANDAKLRSIETQEQADLSHVEKQREDGDLSYQAAAAAEDRIVAAALAANLAILQSEQQIGNLRAVNEQETADRITQIKLRAADRQRQISDQLADEEARKQKQTNQQIASAVSSSLLEIGTGRRSAAQVAIGLADQVLQHELTTLVEAGLKFVENELLKTGARAAGAAAQTGITVAAAAEGKAADAAAGSASVLGNANKAAAGAYAAVAGIPVIGPILAPGAAALAFIAVTAFDVFSARGGLENVPSDNAPALLHKREMVLPAHVADFVRAAVAVPRGVGVPSLATPALNHTANDNRSFAPQFHQSSAYTQNGPGGISRSDFNRSLRKSQSQLKSMARDVMRNGVGGR